MLNNLNFVKLIIIISLLFIFGCSTKSRRPVVPITVFNPNPATFNLKVVLFDLDRNGRPQKLESHVVEIEQKAILALRQAGYTYDPQGKVKYLIEARIGTISPVLAAQGSSQFVGITTGSVLGFNEFENYPVIVKAWSPEIEKLKDGPEDCFLTIQLLVKENQPERDEVFYHGTPRPIKTNNSFGCPFNACGLRAGEELTNYLLNIFS